MLPQANAIVTQIAGGGLSEDEGGSYAGGADTAKWSGSTDAYVSERVLTAAGATGLQEAKETYVIIPGDLTPAVTVLPQDTVTFSYAGVTQTRSVTDIEGHILAGHIRTIKLLLRPT